eukprot:TRINITY_DN23957_c0_g1_i10.p1 TRINITY_DN23957_c0_g1~~TRINITY_DN23957_c0_g1_i10.p1  ORF type:complete len:147 (-),score=50.27 TRINITY_DN23957_c0_g1_i10:249-689(-)
MGCGNDGEEAPNTPLDNARVFFDTCEGGQGWEACKQFVVADAKFECQQNDALDGFGLSEVKTVEAYCEWTKRCKETFGDKATIDLHCSAFDEKNGMATLFSTFGGFSHYVYALKMEGSKISKMTKIWNDTFAANVLAAGAAAEAEE